MTLEEANQIITDAGFNQYEVLEPSKDTRGRWFINIRTASKGWKPFRIYGDAPDPEAQLARFVSSLV